MVAACALGVGLADPPGQTSNELPEPHPRLLMMWQHLADERDRDAEIAGVEHWRVLNGTVLPFDPEEFRELEERIIAHSGTWQDPAAHARDWSWGALVAGRRWSGGQLRSSRNGDADQPSERTVPTIPVENTLRASTGRQCRVL